MHPPSHAGGDRPEDDIFDEALRLCAPARERLEQLRQQISLLQRQERRLARTLSARERAIERARRAFRAAEEEEARILAEAQPKVALAVGSSEESPEKSPGENLEGDLEEALSA